jgi:hypothetical protein
MDEVLQVLEKFEGIIGALLGVMLTLIMTEIFKRTGKFIFYPNKTELSFEKLVDGDYHDYEIVQNKTDADRVNVNLILEIYNSSDSPKILRDGKFSFYKDRNLILSVIPDDNTTTRFSGHWRLRDNFINVNVKNKEIVSIDLIESFDGEKNELIKTCNKLYFEIKSPNSKVHKILIAEF